VLTALGADPPQAVSILADGFAIENRHAIISFATRHRAPAISGWPIFARSGAICTFGPRIADSHRRLAHYVDSIIKGAKPADLPIERPTKFELVINQRAARAIGITIPQSIIVSADEVID
jgi:putative ABC transport system substrate-binding protein